MPEDFRNSEQEENQVQNTPPESVCIDAQRVYDSCGDKDCLKDMKLYFLGCDKEAVESATGVKLCDADVVTVHTTLEKVPFHRGFYSVNMTYYFDLALELVSCPGNPPARVHGLGIFEKKVILYGSEGNVKIFTSDQQHKEKKKPSDNCNMPKATVQVAPPIALSARISKKCDPRKPICVVPREVECHFGGKFDFEISTTIYATIGVFSIVQLQRNVQILVPSYDYCVPKKECVTTSDNPCEMFSHLDFPTDQFFPPNVTDLGDDRAQGACGCNPK